RGKDRTAIPLGEPWCMFPLSPCPLVPLSTLREFLTRQLARQLQSRGELRRVAAAGLGHVLAAAAPAADHLRCLADQLACLDSLLLVSSPFTAVKSCTLPSSTQPRHTTALFAFCRMRSSWARICSTGAAGISPTITLAPLTSAADASSLSAALLRSPATPF